MVEVIAQGDRFRMSVRDAATPDEEYQIVVWDGRAMLLLEGQDASRQEEPPPEERPTPFIIRAGDAAFERICPGGQREGPAQVAGRAGTVYSCPATGAGEIATESSKVTLDDATGLLLNSVSASSRMQAVEVELDVAIDDATFSTEIPAGMRGPEDAVDGSGSPLPLTASDSVPKAGGGELPMADIRQGPSLVVIGELPGVMAMLDMVLPKTGEGKVPPVFVLLNPIPYSEEEPDNTDLPLATEEGTNKLLGQVSAQVQNIPVPVGIDIKGGAAGEDLRPFEDIMVGTTVLAAINESGALDWRMTDEELANNPDQLDTWIASNT